MRAWYAKQPPEKKQAIRRMNAAWEKANPEKTRAYKRDWKKRNPQNARDYRRRLYLRAPEALKARRAAWLAKNKERWYAIKNERERQRRAENPAPYREREKRAYHEGESKKRSLRARRNRQRDALGAHTDAEFDFVCARQKGFCAACGEKKPLTEDHIVPLAKGGSDYILNIQGLCFPCNCRKQARLLPNVQYALFDRPRTLGEV